jgi:hypothetical protein
VLPTFFVIGAMKSGTTSLARYLGGHPDVFMSATKEINYFAREDMWSRGLDWYTAHFAAAGDAVAIGEASVSYSQFPQHADAAARIADVVPDARFVYVVREPVERMRSHYQHWISAGWETRPMGEALLLDARYTYPSRYGLQLSRYLAHFPPERILVVTSEDLRSERAATVGRVLDFLGVTNPWQGSFDTELNRGAGRRMPRSGWGRFRRRVVNSKRLRGLTPAVNAAQTRFPRLATRAVNRDEVMVHPEVRARLVAVLRDDVLALRPWLGDRFESWAADYLG